MVHTRYPQHSSTVAPQVVFGRNPMPNPSPNPNLNPNPNPNLNPNPNPNPNPNQVVYGRDFDGSTLVEARQS